MRKGELGVGFGVRGSSAPRRVRIDDGLREIELRLVAVRHLELGSLPVNEFVEFLSRMDAEFFVDMVRMGFDRAI